MVKRELVKSETGSLEITGAALVGEWLAWLRNAEGASESTITAYARSLNKFRAWLQESGQAGIVTPQTVIAWKAHLSERYAPQTVSLRLCAVRGFYRFLVASERLPVNPASEVKGAKQKGARKHKRDALSNGEVLAVLETCDSSPVGVRDRALLALMAFCGLRTVEVHRADVGALRTSDDRLVLEVQGKGGGERLAVVPRAQEATIRAWLAERSRIMPNGGPLFVSLSRRNPGNRLALSTIRAMVKERYRLAGVAGEDRRKTAHSLRHSAITNAIRHGAAPLQVQAMAGHGSFDTTLTYYHEVSRTAEPAEDLISYEG